MRCKNPLALFIRAQAKQVQPYPHHPSHPVPKVTELALCPREQGTVQQSCKAAGPLFWLPAVLLLCWGLLTEESFPLFFLVQLKLQTLLVDITKCVGPVSLTRLTTEDSF